MKKNNRNLFDNSSLRAKMQMTKFKSAKILNVFLLYHIENSKTR